MMQPQFALIALSLLLSVITALIGVMVKFVI